MKDERNKQKNGRELLVLELCLPILVVWVEHSVGPACLRIMTFEWNDLWSTCISFFIFTCSVWFCVMRKRRNHRSKSRLKFLNCKLVTASCLSSSLWQSDQCDVKLWLTTSTIQMLKKNICKTFLDWNQRFLSQAGRTHFDAEATVTVLDVNSIGQGYSMLVTSLTPSTTNISCRVHYPSPLHLTVSKHWWLSGG